MMPVITQTRLESIYHDSMGQKDPIVELLQPAFGGVSEVFPFR